MSGVGSSPRPIAGPRWQIVARREIADLWVGGRGLGLLFAFSLLLSVIAYLAAINQALNFLERHESVSLVVQVAVAVGALLALLTAADAISGERERRTLESLLLAPLPRRDLIAGKLVGSLSIWAAALLVTIPYVWFLSSNIGGIGTAVGSCALVGTLLALSLASLGLCISTVSASNRFSLSVNLFILLALFAPTQLPAGAKSGWFADFVLKANPVTAGEHYISAVVVQGHRWDADLVWLLSPLICAIVIPLVLLAAMPRALKLGSG